MSLDSVRKGFEKTISFQLAFPHHYQTPAELFQPFFRLLVPIDVPFELIPPEFDIRGRCRRPLAPGMPMPETPPYLDNRPVLRQDDVRMPRQFFDVKPEAEALAKEKGANLYFRSRVP